MTGPEPPDPIRFAVYREENAGFDGGTGPRLTPSILPNYDPKYAATRRAATRYFVSEWLSVANEYLKSHAAAPYDDATRQVIWAISAAVNMREPSDNWPADATAELLSEQLRRYYVTDANDHTDQSPSDPLPLKPAEMLHIIATITGKVPDFARTGLPKPKAVGDRLKQLETALNGNTEPIALMRLFEPRDPNGRPQIGQFVDLYALAPFEVVNLAVGETSARLPRIGRATSSGRGGRRGQGGEGARDSLIQPDEILNYVTYGARVTSDTRSSVTYVDPLFLLTALSQFVGENEAQDDRVHQLLRASIMYYAGQFYVHEQLKSVIAGPTTAGEIARQMLEEMAEKAKSDALRNAVKVILEEAPGDRMDDQEN
jgi:hypothetical protein